MSQSVPTETRSKKVTDYTKEKQQSLAEPNSKQSNARDRTGKQSGSRKKDLEEILYYEGRKRGTRIDQGLRNRTWRLGSRPQPPTSSILRNSRSAPGQWKTRREFEATHMSDGSKTVFNGSGESRRSDPIWRPYRDNLTRVSPFTALSHTWIIDRAQIESDPRRHRRPASVVGGRICLSYSIILVGLKGWKRFGWDVRCRSTVALLIEKSTGLARVLQDDPCRDGGTSSASPVA
ncbi:hypothetical protein B296_00023085 [Ensete ventricosum]|uniref:Uncharacterized protein n=1 Tax=Ensete ventricosum TaxID=4639 RepID=A0A427AHZ1_ENSVE|nr:hypothetical protein B296_00023085 [Ensete ventricosum]